VDCKSDGTKVLIFPEGTRHHNPENRELLKFKSGAFSAAIGAQVDDNLKLKVFWLSFFYGFQIRLFNSLLIKVLYFETFDEPSEYSFLKLTVRV
jgi:1-acyl-sn-glycerol-3-phosphate acyltransferase